MHISDDINIMFRSEHDNTKKKYSFSRKKLELYLENSTLDPIL